ncbi:MAG: 5'-methylthioadenosine/adenosylhomocysteine nucleosidase [Clostridia bacterium]|nr:5'-methylthioadenosine/adenosylhomocysteine nucleosidase [Clostridia bacterium]
MIGIIVAEVEEMEAVKEIMENVNSIDIYDLKIYTGKINNKDFLLVRSGVGKVNAARVAQIITDNFDLSYVINVGSAGSLNEDLKIGDIVLGETLVQHDFDVTAFGRDKGFIPETGKFFESDKNLLEKCKNIQIDNQKIFVGTIASGDTFLTDTTLKEKIKNDFNADCVEMEGAAIAQVCTLNKVPFIVIRSISDIPNGKNEIDFNEYLKLASKNCARFISQL